MKSELKPEKQIQTIQDEIFSYCQINANTSAWKF